MKKTLLFSLLFSSVFSFAQVLQSENFNTLTIGNVGTDITGVTPGQGSWLTFSSNGTAPTTSTNAANTNFQIVSSGNSSSQGLLLQGPNGDKGSRFMWKDGFETAWNARTTGNNIVEVEYDFFTGPATTSTVQSGVRLYGVDGATTRVLCGYVYNSNTRILQGVAYLNNAGTFGTFLITLQTGGLVLNADTWYRVGFGYDTTTGEPYWKFDSNPSVSVNPANFSGPFDPIEVDFVMAVPTTNATSADMTFDNYVAKASNTDTLLNTSLIEASQNSISIYPNPANDVINVAVTNSNGIVSIEKATITDINGRTIKNVASVTNNQINVSDLNSGIYFLTIETAEGNTTKKFIKN